MAFSLLRRLTKQSLGREHMQADVVICVTALLEGAVIWNIPALRPSVMSWLAPEVEITIF